MAVRLTLARRDEVRALQRRRGRPRGLHGPQRPRGGPARGARGHGDRRQGDRLEARLHLLPRRVPARDPPPQRGPRAGPRVGTAGEGHPGDGLRLRHRSLPGRRRLRLRRGDGADDLHRGQARHAPPEAALPGRGGPLGQAQRSEQRGDARQHRPDHPPGRRVVRQRRHRAIQGHKGLRAHGRREQRGPRGSAHGNDPGYDHLRHRRRHPRRQEVQGRPVGRALGRLHPRPAPQRLRRLREGRRARRHHGLGRSHRHERGQVRRRHGALLHGLLQGRVLRQVHPLPRGHAAHARHPDQDLQGQGQGGRHRAARVDGDRHQGRGALRPRPDGPEPRSLHDPLLPQRVRGTHPRQEVPRRRLLGPLQVPLPAHLPDRDGHPGLRGAHPRQPARGRLQGHDEDQPLPVGLRAGLRPPVPDQVPPRPAR